MIDNNNNKSWAQFVFGCCCCVCDLSANRVMYLLLSLPGFARFVGECRRGTKPEHTAIFQLPCHPTRRDIEVGRR